MRKDVYKRQNIDSIFFDITPKIEELALKCEQNNAIEKELYTKYEVKRGLRDLKDVYKRQRMKLLLQIISFSIFWIDTQKYIKKLQIICCLLYTSGVS